MDYVDSEVKPCNIEIVDAIHRPPPKRKTGGTRHMRTSPNTLLWKFIDAVTPSEWKSKQARRLYDAAIRATP